MDGRLDVPELDDPKWIKNLAFLVDMTQVLNKLNLNLQGPNQFVTVAFDNVNAFTLKLQLWKTEFTQQKPQPYSNNQVLYLKKKVKIFLCFVSIDNYVAALENLQQVVLYFVLMLVTCEKSSSTCKFEFVSASSNFETCLKDLTQVLFNDYEVPVVSNLEPDKHCLVLWQIYDTYTMLKNLTVKAQIDLKERIIKLLRELQSVQDCTFLVSETCNKHKQALVRVLQELDFEQLKNIKGDYSNCTVLRCVSGNTIALTDHPDDNLDNITTTYSTEGQDAGTELNAEDALQQKRKNIR
ncbi:fms-related tyrosine kinase 3 ligand isoform X2 [Lithobates pipiens]